MKMMSIAYAVTIILSLNQSLYSFEFSSPAIPSLHDVADLTTLKKSSSLIRAHRNTQLLLQETVYAGGAVGLCCLGIHTLKSTETRDPLSAVALAWPLLEKGLTAIAVGGCLLYAQRQICKLVHAQCDMKRMHDKEELKKEIRKELTEKLAEFATEHIRRIEQAEHSINNQYKAITELRKSNETLHQDVEQVAPLLTTMQATLSHLRQSYETQELLKHTDKLSKDAQIFQKVSSPHKHSLFSSFLSKDDKNK